MLIPAWFISQNLYPETPHPHVVRLLSLGEVPHQEQTSTQPLWLRPKHLGFYCLHYTPQDGRSCNHSTKEPLVKAGLPAHICRVGLKARVKAEGNKGDNKLLRFLYALCWQEVLPPRVWLLHTMYMGNRWHTGKGHTKIELKTKTPNQSQVKRRSFYLFFFKFKKM